MSVATEDLAGLRVDHAEPTDPHTSRSLVLVHGLWAAGWIWERWLPLAASRGWDARAVHLRGRPGSRPVPDPGRTRIESFVEDLRAVLDAVGPSVVVGHSLGGLVVQVAAGVDERVRAMGLVSSIPPRGIVGLSGPLLRRFPRYLPAIATGRPFVPRRRDAAALVCNASPLEVLDAYLARAVPDSAEAARQVLLGSVRAERRRIPTLVVGAGEDRISPPRIQPRLARRYDADLVRFPGLDHLHLLGPKWAGPAGAVLDWAGRVAGSSEPAR